MPKTRSLSISGVQVDEEDHGFCGDRRGCYEGKVKERERTYLRIRPVGLISQKKTLDSDLRSKSSYVLLFEFVIHGPT